MEIDIIEKNFQNEEIKHLSTAKKSYRLPGILGVILLFVGLIILLNISLPIFLIGFIFVVSGWLIGIPVLLYYNLKFNFDRILKRFQLNKEYIKSFCSATSSKIEYGFLLTLGYILVLKHSNKKDIYFTYEISILPSIFSIGISNKKEINNFYIDEKNIIINDNKIPITKDFEGIDKRFTIKKLTIIEMKNRTDLLDYIKTTSELQQVFQNQIYLELTERIFELDIYSNPAKIDQLSKILDIISTAISE